MKVELVRFAKLLAIMVVLQFVAFSSLTQAEEVGVAEVADAAVAVNVIVNIDKDSRAITLKNDEGGEVVFTAGPEVRNFEQLKRGDMVIMEYYSGFAIALEPKGSGLEARVSELTVERAKKGEKPGMRVTASIYIAAKITAVDQKHRTVTLEGPENTVVLEVGDELDLGQIKSGQEVEALYTEAYAVSVVPAPKVSGTMKMKITAVAFGLGVEWGEGTFTMYDGSSHKFKVKGLTVLDVGVSSVEAMGEVYNLVEAKDIEGTFFAGQAGAALVGGGSAVATKNTKGVVMKLKSTQKGVRLTLAGEGLKISLK
jgi:Cu/Ag efflux protein CusF